MTPAIPAADTWSAWAVHDAETGDLIVGAMRSEDDANREAQESAKSGVRCVVVKSTTTITFEAHQVWEAE